MSPMPSACLSITLVPGGRLVPGGGQLLYAEILLDWTLVYLNMKAKASLIKFLISTRVHTLYVARFFSNSASGFMACLAGLNPAASVLAQLQCLFPPPPTPMPS